MLNPYLQGNYAPVQHEVTSHDLEVVGTLPPYLDGRYLRIGPNPMAQVDPDTYNWFMGDGMAHGLRLRDGQAQWYRNRWVRTPQLTRALGEPLSPGRKKVPVEMLGANTNVIGHAGRTLALVEAGTTCHELDDELNTIGPHDFDATLRSGYTAHPKRDPKTGELHAISYFFGRPRQVQYSVIDAAGRARKVLDIPVTGRPMIHDMSLTERYAVIYDLPVTFDARAAVEVSMPRLLRPAGALLMSTMLARRAIPGPLVPAITRTIPANAGFPYRWNPDYPARIGLLPREGTAQDVRWFEVEPCYVFHALNAYDEGDTVVLDVVRHPKIFATELHGPNEGIPTLERWEFDLATGKIAQSQLDERPQEFPRINETLLGARHRYGYSVSVAPDEAWERYVIKHDLAAGTSQLHDVGAGRQTSEFVFVPAENPTAEDDGVLMGFVYDRPSDRSSLEILDAGSMEPLASVRLPARVPAGFHGNWVSSA